MDKADKNRNMKGSTTISPATQSNIDTIRA
jgi:hypothetical protein